MKPEQFDRLIRAMNDLSSSIRNVGIFVIVMMTISTCNLAVALNGAAKDVGHDIRYAGDSIPRELTVKVR